MFPIFSIIGMPVIPRRRSIVKAGADKDPYNLLSLKSVQITIRQIDHHIKISPK